MPAFIQSSRHALLAKACLLVVAIQAQAGSIDVTASRNDDARTGAMSHETLLNPDSVSETVHPGGFGKLVDYDLNLIGGRPAGEIYAQPLYLGGIGVPGHGLTNALIVATMSNLLIALDADGPRPGEDGVLWRRDLGVPADMQTDVWANCQVTHDCLAPVGNNIRGVAGIGSTPVVDRERGILFVVNRELTGPGIDVAYRIHALDMRSGQELSGSPETIGGSHLGATFNPNWQNQRPGLALSGGQVIVGFGAYEDLLPYRGWLFSFRYDSGVGFVRTGVIATTPDGEVSTDCARVVPTAASAAAQVAEGLAAAKLLFDAFFDPAMIPIDVAAIGVAQAALDLASIPPEAAAANRCAHGGIWMAGRAPAVDSDGRVIVAVGNGRNDMGAAPNRNFGNGLLALDPVTLRVLDSFTPSNHIALNARDLDLGGSGPMLVPGSQLVVGGGKQGVMYVWKLDHLGGFSATDAGAMQSFVAGNVEWHFDTGMDNPGGVVDVQHLLRSLTFNENLHAGHIMGGPVLWQRPQADGGSRLYNWSENTELRMYAVDEDSSSPIALPELAGSTFVQAGHPGGILSLSSDGARAGTGIVWASTYDASGTAHPVLGVTGALIDHVPGVLRAYSAETLDPLWTSPETGTEAVGTFAKFNPPTVANGRVYIANFDGHVLGYGLTDHHYARPSKFILDVVQMLLDDQ
ncbi:MAG: hypothetical protein JSR59_16900 [Proteobacteria bacterium]|nr:hypothetical protein [Pseudomonadota bacterium]